MLSTLLELAGFGAIIAGLYLLAGLAVGLLALGAVLVFVGFAQG